MKKHLEVHLDTTADNREAIYFPQRNSFICWGQSLLTVIPENAQLYRHSTSDCVEVGVKIVGAEEGLLLNSQYRGKSKPTNVLSFAFAPLVDPGYCYFGDIVLTAPVIEKEVADLDKDAAEHWAHLFIHAFLHLLGFRHDTDSCSKVMQRMETKIMTNLGYCDPYS